MVEELINKVEAAAVNTKTTEKMVHAIVLPKHPHNLRLTLMVSEPVLKKDRRSWSATYQTDIPEKVCWMISMNFLVPLISFICQWIYRHIPTLAMLSLIFQT
jgi:hypothetical protein